MTDKPKITRVSKQYTMEDYKQQHGSYQDMADDYEDLGMPVPGELAREITCLAKKIKHKRKLTPMIKADKIKDYNERIEYWYGRINRILAKPTDQASLDRYNQIQSKIYELTRKMENIHVKEPELGFYSMPVAQGTPIYKKGVRL